MIVITKGFCNPCIIKIEKEEITFLFTDKWNVFFFILPYMSISVADEKICQVEG